MKQVVVIAGPSGSGETTITKKLVEQFPTVFRRLVTATTRKPRVNEQHGVDYYFFSQEVFFSKKDKGEMLETTYVPNRNVHYGTYAPDLNEKMAAGFVVIVNPDIVGARYYKERHNATTIFIMPKSIAELEGRLRKRDAGMTEKELAHRLSNAEREIKEEASFYDYTVVNGDGMLDETMEAVVKILRNEEYQF